ncbi:MAG: glycosyltransferase family 2 protein [Rhodocyclaceae bacterium]|nr:glycosyltransferase family 2 protein [Rhodocyclaceae bacterium]MCA3077154.1 glycosyltransferase family 2 protein [Rhodocyclaceae bacterium]MCA3090499.1 glycosyltransferase family 2 protein [Rhodocyclaceae bacterium]MCA3094725.1 glycosyltransferase family 2 protein [Rhodocyclaceae bacterium]MCA3097914.1 glycosyltransferase family 2 protein [Rhodocyclaceae bacterium]
MKLSIVTTLYQSAAYVEEFHRRASAVAAHHAAGSYELVFVNDGSPDDSLERAVALSRADPHVVVVDLSRNFGHHKAMMTGLAYARGERVYLLDSDLEEEPEWFDAFLARLEDEGCDVVYGVQRNRKGGRFERWSGRMFYRLMNAIIGFEMPTDMVTARLMTRRYVDALLRHEERELDIGGLWVITGFAQRACIVDKHHTSATTYSLRRRVALLIDSVTSFSSVPLVATFYIGVAIFVVAALFAAGIVVQWALLDRPVSGWASLIVSIWMIGAMIISFIGILGIYLAKMFVEVKRRPYTIVREVHGRGSL